MEQHGGGENVVFCLIDFFKTPSSSSSESNNNSSPLQNYLKQKFREPTKMEYSGRFIIEKIIDFENTFYNFVIVREYNLLMIIFGNGEVKFLDLDSYIVVLSLNVGKGLKTVTLERAIPSQLSVILGASNDILLKYDLKKILEEKLTNDSLSTALIWEKTIDCEFLWGIGSMENQIFVIDYNNDAIRVYDSKTGDSVLRILPGFNNLVDLKFLPNGDLIACGNKFVGLFKKDENGEWKVHKKVHSTENELNRCFAIYYEEKSEKIYISDADGSVCVFSKDLVQLSKHKLEEFNDNYCLVVNEKNGKMLISNSGKMQLLILN
ncbi:predicted protein [Naegleria gruberi]|uniref:Predicted protein n=1 Tax=Naegleria gruberi TaxID=5762 RepID=D2VF00_NAEGR|nr:uncharacterized protein NAEGRDRAFT_67454 [Naegleria gruberi]EFC44596.1 predicted protein [Naegleria gruberi]|eukprot:XP_002677340.1 predicted protein [Naegleria gruberi strain NEG-M]